MRICCRLAGDVTDLSTACHQRAVNLRAVNLSILNHIELICCRYAVHKTDFSTISRYVGVLRTNPLLANALELLPTQRICCRLAVDLLEICCADGHPASLQQICSKSVQCGLSLTRHIRHGRTLVNKKYGLSMGRDAIFGLNLPIISAHQNRCAG